MKNVKFYAFLLSVLLYAQIPIYAQSPTLTKESVLAMSVEQLSELPIEDLMRAVELLGVNSVDELFAILMNKNVSSASKKDEKAFSSPLATTVITQDEMRAYGCKSIEEAFRLIPGVIVSQKTNGIYDIQMRGLNNIPDGNMLLYTENANVLLMIDGRVVHNYSIGTMTMENLPIAIVDVDRIEVVRGACSALYGVNAVNGVINIITRRPDSTLPSLSGSVSAGSLNSYVGEIAYRSKANNKVAWGVSANLQVRHRSTSDLYTAPASNTYVTSNLGLVGQSMTNEQIDALVESGMLRPIGGNAQWSVSDFSNMVLLAPSGNIDGGQQLFFSTPTEYRDAHKCFEDPSLARRSAGVNGYLDITPNADMAFRITGGYAQSLAMQTTVMESPYSMAFRQFKKGYVNIDARIHDAHAQFNYYAGPEDYAVGRPGLKANFQQIFASIDYDLFFGDLNIRPGVHFQYMYGKDYKPTFDYGNGPVEMSGFFNDDATLMSYAPSLRLDYSLDNWRFIVAARSDKTSIPDKWNLSLQGVVDYQFNDQNFIRLNYGRGVRSASMLNANSNYRWTRTGMDAPNTIEFFGNEDADLVSIDNFELGYRWQPVDGLLLDAEVFYSRSKDYGAMMSFNAKATSSYTDMYTSVSNIVAMKDTDGNINLNDAYNLLRSNVSSRSNSSYGNLPYKVSQMGLSLNVDWIITPKVVAKLNANVQNTTIDNYYLYNQAASLNQQFYEANGVVESMSNGLQDLVYCIEGRSTDGTQVVCTDESRLGSNIVSAISTISHSNTYQAMFNSWDQNKQQQFLEALRNAYFNSKDFFIDEEGTFGRKKASYQNCLALYYALRYGMDYDYKNKEYSFAQSHNEEPKKENGHKHKATPSIYGMMGVIVKPTSGLNISAYANFMGKRTFTTAYGTETLDNRVTLNAKVGYSPVKEFEVFVSADNLLNTKAQEFVYTDKIGGVYTVGLNINF